MAKTFYKLCDKTTRYQVLQKYGKRCAYCGCELTLSSLSIDHVVPLRRKMDNCVQGDNHIDNYNPACRSCNSSKSSMDLDKWKGELSKKLSRLERDSCTYRLAKRFGMIKEVKKKVVFYFETFNEK